MNEKTLFLVPYYDPRAPMIESDFYKWLDNSNTRHTHMFDSIDRYLQQFGYDFEKHKLDPDELRGMEYIFEMYNQLFTPIREPIELHKLLRASEPRGYWLRDYDVPVWPTALLRATLKDAGLIYNLDPQNYYFEIINGYLFIKYQFIIGSRRIAKIKSNTDEA